MISKIYKFKALGLYIFDVVGEFFLLNLIDDKGSVDGS